MNENKYEYYGNQLKYLLCDLEHSRELLAQEHDVVDQSHARLLQKDIKQTKIDIKKHIEKMNIDYQL